MEEQGPFAPRTRELIGREEIIEEILQAIVDTGGNRIAFYLVGSGGIGKTRILEEVFGRVRSDPEYQTAQCSKIIDLYHADFYSLGNLRNQIIQSISTESPEAFANYHRIEAEFEKTLDKEKPIENEVEALLPKLADAFLEDYVQFSSGKRIVLLFDTLEVLAHEPEIDVVQEILEEEEPDTSVLGWLQRNATKLTNTVIVFASRRALEVKEAIHSSFSGTGWDFRIRDIGPLTSDQTRAYLDDLFNQPKLKAKLAEFSPSAPQDLPPQIYGLSDGRPILLTLLVDLILSGIPVDSLLSSPTNPGVQSEIIGKTLVDRLGLLPGNLKSAFDALVCARKGMSTELLVSLTQCSQKEAIDLWKKLRGLAIVKTRPTDDTTDGTTRLYLHDEIYDILDKEQHDRRHIPMLGDTVKYYREQKERLDRKGSRYNGDRVQYERMLTELLYYELQVGVPNGYFDCYVPWTEDAIRNQEIGWDLRLRYAVRLQDELLRFLKRYVNEDSPYYDRHIAEEIDRKFIDRDRAVRWVNRYIALGKYDKAIKAAKRLRHGENVDFNFDTVADPLYKASLMIAQSEAAVVGGAVSDDTESDFKEAIRLLESERASTASPERTKKRISHLLGVAHKELGYFHRSRGEYGLAAEEYKKALSCFSDEKANLETSDTEIANTLTNLAYLQGLLGHAELAKRNIERAVKMRLAIGAKYSLALSYNTHGIIRSIADEPTWGRELCTNALELCEQEDNLRGIGLAHNGIGFACRKLGNQWKHGRYGYEDAEEFFRDAKKHFRAAKMIFDPTSVDEPLRLWEAYSELGSLYCDWAWLLLEQFKVGNEDISSERVIKLYRKSIRYQEKALRIAEGQKSEYHANDTTDDLAQVHADLSFALLVVRPDKTKKIDRHRKHAERYLSELHDRIPSQYTGEGDGFANNIESDHMYLQSLAKIHRWRGTWRIKDIEYRSGTDILPAIRDFLLAIVYSQKSRPASLELGKTINVFLDYMEQNHVKRSTLESEIGKVEKAYRVDLQSVRTRISDEFGFQ